MTTGAGNPLEALIAEWTRTHEGLSGEAKRDAAVEFVMSKLDLPPATRWLLKMAYDRLMTVPTVKGGDEHVCSACGLNDGHHYARCIFARKPLR